MTYNKIMMMAIKNSSLPFDLKTHHCHLCNKLKIKNKKLLVIIICNNI